MGYGRMPSHVIRNHDGNIISIDRERTHEEGVVQIEAWTLFEGVKRVEALGIRKLVIEVDNLAVINALKKKWKPPWEIQMIMTDIRALLQLVTKVEVFHCYGEGNQAKDFLAMDNCNHSSIQSNPMHREFHAIIRKDELGWSFVRKTA